MTICFVSNYINHHQIPFCSALEKELQSRNPEGEFFFIQTQPMEEERVKMGWDENNVPDFVVKYYQEPERAQQLIDTCDVLLFGGVEDESYIQGRLKSGKLIFRYTERLYREGQWKAISPRGLKKKYLDHTRYRKSPVYVLCAGAYVADDFHIVRAYPDKKFCWGYFPQKMQYDVDKLLDGKGYLTPEGEKVPYLLWCGRLISCKHAHLALETAAYLKQQGLRFHMDMICSGELEPQIRQMHESLGLQKEVTLLGFMSPEEVRGYMEKADIFLFTSDRGEGWGAVVNEAMNSGCAVAAGHMAGSIPYLIRHEKNGFVFKDGDSQMFFGIAEKLVRDPALRRQIGEQAYQTIANEWNAENAARQLLLLTEKLKETPEGIKANPEVREFAPGQPAPVIGERKMFRFLTGRR